MDYLALFGLIVTWLVGVFATLNALDGAMLTYHYARCRNTQGSVIMAGWTLFLTGVLVVCILAFAWIWNQLY